MEWYVQQTIEVLHRTVRTDRSFDDVIARLHSLTGSVEEGFEAALSDVDDLEGFTSRMKAREGRSGFMRFLRIDHGAWMTKYFHEAVRSVTYLLGNPLIAIDMLRQDPEAGLNVPFRLMVVEDGVGAKIIYDLPSTLMSGLDQSVVGHAERLDANIERLIDEVAAARV